MNTIAVDESRWPLVTIRYAPRVDDSDFDELLGTLSRCLARAEAERVKNCFLYDVRSGYAGSASIRNKQAEWMKRNRTRISQNTAGVAFVATSRLVRGALTAVFWVAPMAAPYKITETIEHGRVWCNAQLEEANGFGISSVSDEPSNHRTQA